MITDILSFNLQYSLACKLNYNSVLMETSWKSYSDISLYIAVYFTNGEVTEEKNAKLQ